MFNDGGASFTCIPTWFPCRPLLLAPLPDESAHAEASQFPPGYRPPCNQFPGPCSLDRLACGERAAACSYRSSDSSMPGIHLAHGFCYAHRQSLLNTGLTSNPSTCRARSLIHPPFQPPSSDHQVGYSQDRRATSLLRLCSHLTLRRTARLSRAEFLQHNHDTRVVVGTPVCQPTSAHQNAAPCFKEDTL